MKKTLLSVVAGLAVIGSAFAVPSLDRQREDCEENPNFVWVECNNTCVPINPCLSEDKSIRYGYCVKYFEYTRLRKDFLEMPINAFLDKIARTTVKEYSIVNDVYVAVKRTDGCYQVFEFESLYPENGTDGAGVSELFKVAKMLYGFGDPDDAPSSTIISPCKRSFLAAPIMKKDCIKLVDFYRDLITSENCEVEFVFANDPKEILNYTNFTSNDLPSLQHFFIYS